MKKIILLTLMTVTLLLLVSCITYNETTSNASVSTSITNDIEDVNSTNDLPSDEVIESELVSVEVSEVKSSETTEDITTEETIVQLGLIDPIYTNDSVVYVLKNAYYNEDGGIVVEGYIENVTDHGADHMRLKKLELYNENNELIASNSFGYIQENFGIVDAGNKLEVSFTFPAINVYKRNDNFDSVKSVSKFTSVHW